MASDIDLLDSFALSDHEEPTDGAFAVDAPSDGLSILDSFAVDAASEAQTSGVDPHVCIVHPCLVRQEIAAPHEAPPMVESRGRKRGQTRHALAVRRAEQAPESDPRQATPVPQTRREIVSAVGKASARARRDRALQKDPRQTTLTSTFAAQAQSCEALVVHSGSMIMPGTMSESELLQQAIAVCRPNPKYPSKGIEAGVLQCSLRGTSKKLLSEKLKCSEQVVTRRLRLIAACIVLVRKFWALNDLSGFDNFLHTHFPPGEIRRVNYLLKYKSDEMSMRLKVQTKAGAEFAVSKLLQIVPKCVVLYKIRDRHVRLHLPLPSLLKPIEAATTKCTRRALDSCCLAPSRALTFETQTRLPVADLHPSNTGADESYASEFPHERLHRFHCLAHVACRVGNRGFQVFPNERKGLLHTALAANFGGTLLLLKEQMKRVIRRDARWFDSASGAGQDAATYREQIFQLCCDPTQTAARRTRSAKALIYHKRRALLNGRYKRRGRVEHFCPNRECCRDMDHWLVQCDGLIDQEMGPRQYCDQRWTGTEDTTDWMLFYLLCHDIVSIALEEIFVTGKEKQNASRDKPDPQMAELCDRDEDSDGEEPPTHLPEEDLGLPEPVKEDSYEKKQSTFRRNSLIWVRSKPAGRLAAFRSCIRPQQHSARKIIKDASKADKMEELKRRQRGGLPSFRVVKAADGRYTDDAILQWTAMMRGGTDWSVLPADFRTHELSVQTFRALSAMLCTKHELMVTVFKAYPVSGYRLLSRIVGEDVLAAEQLEHDIKYNPCLLCPRWYEHCQRYPTAKELLSKDSKAEAAHHADEIDLDNVDVETGNTLIHRSIKRCLQQKLAHMEDVGALFVLQSDRQIHTSPFGTKTYPADTENAMPATGKRKRRGGGGGLCRAFVSHMSKSCRTADGSLDFARIMELHRLEKGRPVCELLQSLRAEGRLATKARTDQCKAGKRWSMSSFGAINPRVVERQKKVESLRLYKDIMASAGATEKAPHGLGALQIVPHAEAGHLERVAGKRISDQISMLRSLGRLEASDVRKKLEKEEDEFRTHMQNAKGDFFGLDFSELQSEHSQVHTMQSGDILDVWVHRDCCSFVTERLPSMVEESGTAVRRLQELWATEHKLVTKACSSSLDPVSASAKPSFCQQFGGGRCLCKGDGYVERLAAQNLGKELCIRAPKTNCISGASADSQYRPEDTGCLAACGAAIFPAKTPHVFDDEVVARPSMGTPCPSAYLQRQEG